MIVNDHFDTDADVRPICQAAAAVLAVTGARLHLVTRVVHGHVDAEVLVAPFNDAQAAERHADVVLRPGTRQQESTSRPTRAAGQR